MNRRQFLLSAGAATVRGKYLELRFQAHWIANLTFTLDALADLSGTNAAAYREMLDKPLLWNGEDDRQLMRWKNARRAVMAAAQVAATPRRIAWPPNYPSFYGESFRLDHQVRAAGLAAQSLDQYGKLARKAAGPLQGDILLSVVRHFAPRYQELWESGLRQQAEAHAATLSARAGKHGLLEFAENLIGFTAAPITRRQTIWIHVMARQERFGLGTTATQLGQHAIVEILDKEPAEEKLGVIVHELAHYFYDSAPEVMHLGLMKEFQEMKQPWRLAAYSYLNEALATAAGILVEQRLRAKDSFAAWIANPMTVYSQPWVAATGIATYELLSEQISKGLFNGFAQPYMERVEQSLGARTAHPHFLLASRVIVVSSPRLRRASDLFRSRVPAITNATSWESVSRFYETPVVALGLNEELSGMLERIGPGRPVTQITGSTPVEVEDKVERFALQPAG